MNKITMILSERKLHKESCDSFVFQAVGYEDGTGVGFPVDETGRPAINSSEFKGCMREYVYCVSHPEEYKPVGVQATVFEQVKPAVAQCSCGRRVVLDGISQCRCGQYYDSLGRALVDPKVFPGEKFGKKEMYDLVASSMNDLFISYQVMNGVHPKNLSPVQEQQMEKIQSDIMDLILSVCMRDKGCTES